jgi:hypothetical protein
MTGKNGEQAREHEVLNEIVRRSVAIKADVVRQVHFLANGGFVHVHLRTLTHMYGREGSDAIEQI